MEEIKMSELKIAKPPIEKVDRTPGAVWRKMK
jgi:hypothetical protein